MVLFYAVECGLKAAIAHRRGMREIDSLPEDLRTHDVRRLARELRLAPPSFPVLVDVPMNSGRSFVAAGDVHLAWRYGAVLVPEEEAGTLAALQRFDEWCEEELGG